MGVMDWLQRKGHEKSASGILDGLRLLVVAVRADVNERAGDASHVATPASAVPRGGEMAEADATATLQAGERWRIRKAQVVEAQRKLLQDVTLPGSLGADRTLNDVVLPALRSGALVAPSEPCFGPAVVAAFRVLEAVAQEQGITLADRAPADVRQMVKDAGDLYKLGASDEGPGHP